MMKKMSNKEKIKEKGAVAVGIDCQTNQLTLD